MGPVVAVEISTQGSQPSYAAALVAACTRAVHRGTCVLADASPEARDAEGIAIVSWQGTDQDDARVQVGVRRADGGTAWLARDMHFRDADAPVERWRAVGLTIATLVGELPEPPPRPTSHAVAPLPRRAPPAVPRRTGKPEAPLPARWWLDAGAVLGPGLDTGSWRVGGFLGVARRFDRSPLFAHAAASYAARPSDALGVAANWFTLSLGPGVALAIPRADLVLDLRGALGLERVHASATRGGDEDSGSRWVPELRLGGNVAWPGGYLSVVAGGEMWAMQSATTIRVSDEATGRVPALGGSLHLGVRVGLP